MKNRLTKLLAVVAIGATVAATQAQQTQAQQTQAQTQIQTQAQAQAQSPVQPQAQAQSQAQALTENVLDLYLMRHGQTQWNLEKRLQGGTDNALNATGEKQAAELAQHLRGVRFDHVYSSALKRARQTAEAVAAGATVSALPALNERSFGKFEGIFEDERDAERFAEYKQRAGKLDDALDGGESLQSQADRVKTAVTEIVARHPKGSVAIVAHGGVNPLVLAALLDLPVAEAVERIKQGNDELYLVRVRPQQAPSVWKVITRATLEQL